MLKKFFALVLFIVSFVTFEVSSHAFWDSDYRRANHWYVETFVKALLYHKSLGTVNTIELFP